MSGAIRSFLEARIPHRVFAEASDGRAAIEKAKQSSCDMILLDLSMTKPTGAETALALRQILPQAKIVGFSTAGVDLGAQELAAAGLDAVLFKQDGLAELAGIVVSLLPTQAES